MAGNTVTLTFAGDAGQLQKEAKKAEVALQGVGKSAMTASADFNNTASQTTGLTDKMGKLGSTMSGATDAIDAVGASAQALADAQNFASARAQRLARATNDVQQANEDAAQATQDYRQAQQDLTQSILDGSQAQQDGRQATIDAEQAALDAEQAQKDYNKAVKEHGKNSIEARQAQIDLKQAQADLNQAQIDGKQATQDGKQATLDASQSVRDMAQANIDAKTAQLDLNDAQKEANPSGLQEFADVLGVITPLLSGLVGIFGLVTAAQWLWNIASAANPTTWIVLGIVAAVALIIGAIYLVWKNWDKIWGWIKKAAVAVWDWIKELPKKIGGVFDTISNAIKNAFKAAFNFVADVWNNTIGKLSWTVPDWIPGIGGSRVSVPNIPKFHSGGVVPGVPGSEQLAILQAGEKVLPSTSAGGTVLEIHSGGSKMDDLLVEILRRSVRTRGGNVQLVLGSNRG